MTNSNNPLVSVVVPIFNVEKYIKKCVESITSQSYKNIEIILIDDGSPDGSGAIVDQLAVLDKRITVVHQKNSGVSSARNIGLSLCSGVYVCFVDGDDWLDEHFLEKLVEHAINYKSDFVVAKFVAQDGLRVQMNGSKKVSRDQITEDFLYGRIIIGSWNKIFKRDVIEKNKITFDEKYFMGEGLNFILRFAGFAENIVVVDDALYFYRTDNLSSATKFVEVKKIKNALKAIDGIKNFLANRSTAVNIAVDSHRWATCLYGLKAIKKIDLKGDIEFRDGCEKILKNYAHTVVFKSKANKKQKIFALIIVLSLGLAAKIFRLKK